MTIHGIPVPDRGIARASTGGETDRRARPNAPPRSHARAINQWRPASEKGAAQGEEEGSHLLGWMGAWKGKICLSLWRERAFEGFGKGKTKNDSRNVKSARLREPTPGGLQGAVRESGTRSDA